MAVLTQNAVLRFRRPEQEKRDVFQMDSSGSQQFYTGSPVIIDQSVDTANVRQFIDTATPTLATGDVFVGIAAGPATIAQGAQELNSELHVIVSGPVGFKSSAFTDADMGKDIYMSDNATLTLSAGSGANLKIGKIERVQDGFVYVDINPLGVPNVI